MLLTIKVCVTSEYILNMYNKHPIEMFLKLCGLGVQVIAECGALSHIVLHGKIERVQYLEQEVTKNETIN